MRLCVIVFIFSCFCFVGSTSLKRRKHYKLCQLPVKIGACSARFSRWYYSSDGMCKQFYYSGCEGNENNFETAESCYEGCGDINDACNSPVVAAPCKFGNIAWFYNKTSKTCARFRDGTCAKNINNFGDKESCRKHCVKAPSNPEQDAQSKKICNLRVRPGPCHFQIPRWYHDLDGVCKQFIYGGCGGNKNNFGSAWDCFKVCGQIEDACNLPVVTQTCSIFNISWWYYNKAVDTCEMSKSGDCPFNENVFHNLESCLDNCRKTLPATEISPTELCRLPRVRGTCHSRLPRWYHKGNGQCKRFIYRGCGGNSNNFKNLEKCRQMCANVTSVDDDTTQNAPTFHY